MRLFIDFENINLLEKKDLNSIFLTVDYPELEV